MVRDGQIQGPKNLRLQQLVTSQGISGKPCTLEVWNDDFSPPWDVVFKPRLTTLKNILEAENHEKTTQLIFITDDLEGPPPLSPTGRSR